MNYLRNLYRTLFKVDAQSFVTKQQEQENKFLMTQGFKKAEYILDVEKARDSKQQLVEKLALSMSKDEEEISILFGEK